MLAFNKFASVRPRPPISEKGFFFSVGVGDDFSGGMPKNASTFFCCLSSFFVSKSESGRIGVKWIPFVMMMLLLHADFQDHGDNPKWAAPTRPASCLSFGCGNAPGRLGVFF